MLWYMDNFIFILIFVYFRCDFVNNITVSTVHLKLLITAVCANIPAKSTLSSAFNNLFVHSVDYFVHPMCLVLSHYMPLCVMNLWPNLLPVLFIYCYRREGCLLNSAVGTGGEDKM